MKLKLCQIDNILCPGTSWRVWLRANLILVRGGSRRSRSCPILSLMDPYVDPMLIFPVVPFTQSYSMTLYDILELVEGQMQWGGAGGPFFVEF